MMVLDAKCASAADTASSTSGIVVATRGRGCALVVGCQNVVSPTRFLVPPTDRWDGKVIIFQKTKK